MGIHLPSRIEGVIDKSGQGIDRFEAAQVQDIGYGFTARAGEIPPGQSFRGLVHIEDSLIRGESDRGFVNMFDGNQEIVEKPAIAMGFAFDMGETDTTSFFIDEYQTQDPGRDYRPGKVGEAWSGVTSRKVD